MEKKQNIAMKKLYFVLVIALGSSCQGAIILGQHYSSRWELSGGIVTGGNCLGVIFYVRIVWAGMGGG